MKKDILNAEIVLDECMPIRIYNLFECLNYVTVLGSIWEGNKNGKLLGCCRDNNVNILITCDKAIEREQIKNIHNYSVSLVILKSKTNDTDEVEPLAKKFIYLYLKDKYLFKERKIYVIDEDALYECFLQKEDKSGRLTIGYNEIAVKK